MSMDFSIEDPSRSRTSSPLNDIPDILSDAPAEGGSGYSPSESDPPTPIIDGESANMAAEHSTMKTYRPYDVEEPDDDNIDTTVRRLYLRLPDSFERWQRDLAEHMDDARDGTPLHTPLGKQINNPRRGQKRKPVSAPAGGGHHSESPFQRSKSGFNYGEESLPVPGLSPKRRRRRSRLFDSTNTAPVVSIHDFRETEANESSSSEVWSTDESADNMHDYAVTDDMDLD